MNDIVQTIKKRIALSSVVKQAIELKGSGSHFLGLCPFHKEKTPSFNVRDNVGSFKCFGCGASGDVFAFIMRLRGIGFKEAVNELSAQAGIITAEARAQPKKSTSNDQALLHAQAVAARFFKDQLQTPAGKSVHNYLLTERRLKESMIEQAGIGFGGSSAKEFLSYLAKNNVKESIAVEAGLLKSGTFSLQGQFLGRITIPIKRTDGKIIAFGGRIFQSDDQQAPKYVNTHAYVHYEKKKHFYGLYESHKAIMQGKVPVLVEGYFDAMAMWAAGVPALALCGTALSDEHVAYLKGLSSRLMICFDDDEAGYKALRTSLIKLWGKNIATSAIVLDKKDPADYLADNQLGQLKECIARAADATCLAIDRVGLTIGRDISTRISQVDELLPIFSSIQRPLMRRQYVAYLAEKIHEDPQLLWGEIGKKAKKSKEPVATNQPLQLNAEEKCVLLIARSQPHLIGQISQSIWEKIRGSLQHACEHAQEKPEVLEPYLNESTPLFLSLSEAQEMLAGLEARAVRQNRHKAIHLKRQELQRAEKDKDFAKVLQTLKEQSSLLAEEKPRSCKPERLEIESAEPIPRKKANEIKPIEKPVVEIDYGQDWI